MAGMSAKDAVEILEKLIPDIENDMTIYAYESAALRTAAAVLRKVATGELREAVHGEWIAVEPGHDILFQCSNCGRIISTSWGSCEDEDTHGENGCDPTDEWLSCPTCGALLDGKDGSDDKD